MKPLSFQSSSQFPPSRGDLATATKSSAPFPTGVEISEKIAAQLADEEGMTLVLTDEISQGRVDYLVAECRHLLPEKEVTSENWEALKVFLAQEMTDFSELRSSYKAAFRKCLMAEQRVNEAALPQEGKVSESRLMACSMVLLESRMRRDHLQARIAMVIDELTSRILAGRRKKVDHGLELRLRAVFGKL